MGIFTKAKDSSIIDELIIAKLSEDLDLEETADGKPMFKSAQGTIFVNDNNIVVKHKGEATYKDKDAFLTYIS